MRDIEVGKQMVWHSWRRWQVYGTNRIQFDGNAWGSCLEINWDVFDSAQEKRATLVRLDQLKVERKGGNLEHANIFYRFSVL